MAARPRQGGASEGEGGGADAVMAVADMRLLLNQSKRKPVACAVAMTKDKQALLLLHRTMGPKKVRAELRKQAKAAGLDLDLTTLRFGRATVDGGSDSQCVDISTNKAVPNASAFELKLRERVKPAGFKRCSLSVDEGLESEPDEDAPAGEAAPGTPTAGPAHANGNQPDTPSLAPAAPRASPPSLSGMPASTAAGTVRPASSAGATAAAPNTGQPLASASPPAPAAHAGEVAASLDRRAAALESRLASAVRRMAAAPHPEPDAEQARRQAARMGRDALRAGDLARAEQVTRKLEEVLAGQPALAQAATPAPAAGQPGADPQPQPGSASGQPQAAPQQPAPGQPGFAAAALRAGFDRAAATPRDRSGDVQVAQAASGTSGTATDATPSAPLPGSPDACPPSDYERKLREAAEAHRARTVAYWQAQYDQARQNPWGSRIGPYEAWQNLENAKQAPLSHFVDGGLLDRGRMNALEAGRQNMREMAEFRSPEADAELCRRQQAIDGNSTDQGVMGLLSEGVEQVGPAVVGVLVGGGGGRSAAPSGRAPSWQRPQPPSVPRGEVPPSTATPPAALPPGATGQTRPASAVPDLKPPNSRHYASGVTDGSWRKKVNTMIAPGVDIEPDLQAIRDGRALRDGPYWVVGQRYYNWHPETRQFFPVSGPGFITVDPRGFQAIGIYNKEGFTAAAEAIMDQRRIPQEQRALARAVLGKP